MHKTLTEKRAGYTFRKRIEKYVSRILYSNQKWSSILFSILGFLMTQKHVAPVVVAHNVIFRVKFYFILFFDLQ